MVFVDRHFTQWSDQTDEKRHNDIKDYKHLPEVRSGQHELMFHRGVQKVPVLQNLISDFFLKGRTVSASN